MIGFKENHSRVPKGYSSFLRVGNESTVCRGSIADIHVRILIPRRMVVVEADSTQEVSVWTEIQ